jgi:hypothetical protein
MTINDGQCVRRTSALSTGGRGPPRAATAALDRFLNGREISVGVYYAFDGMIACPTSEMLSFKTEIAIAIGAASRERCRLAAIWADWSIDSAIAARLSFLTKHDLRPQFTQRQSEFRNVSGGWRASQQAASNEEVIHREGIGLRDGCKSDQHQVLLALHMA